MEKFEDNKLDRIARTPNTPIPFLWHSLLDAHRRGEHPSPGTLHLVDMDRRTPVVLLHVGYTLDANSEFVTRSGLLHLGEMEFGVFVHHPDEGPIALRLKGNAADGKRHTIWLWRIEWHRMLIDSGMAHPPKDPFEPYRRRKRAGAAK